MPFMAWEDLAWHDTWQVAGLRGTGSVDFSAQAVVVPPERVVALGQVPRQATTMFRLPFGAWLAMGKAAVATGIARGALDECLTLLTRTPAFATTRLREEPRIQWQIAEAEATLRAARAFLYDALQAAWHAAEQDQPVPLRESALLRLASVHATTAACDTVELAYQAQI